MKLKETFSGGIKVKKFISLFLCIAMVFTMFSTTAFAESQKNTVEFDGKTYDVTNEHPWVFVHGMGGWNKYGEEAYWGGWASSEGDVIDLYNKNGIEAYAAVVGPFNSAWDRACELYAQLTGTVVDYGEAHSKEHNHERYGYDGYAPCGICQTGVPCESCNPRKGR